MARYALCGAQPRRACAATSRQRRPKKTTMTRTAVQRGAEGPDDDIGLPSASVSIGFVVCLSGERTGFMAVVLLGCATHASGVRCSGISMRLVRRNGARTIRCAKSTTRSRSAMKRALRRREVHAGDMRCGLRGRRAPLLKALLRGAREAMVRRAQAQDDTAHARALSFVHRGWRTDCAVCAQPIRRRRLAAARHRGVVAHRVGGRAALSCARPRRHRPRMRNRSTGQGAPQGNSAADQNSPPPRRGKTQPA